MFEEEEEEEVHAVSIDSRSVIGCDMDFAAQRKDSSDTISDDFELDEDDAVEDRRDVHVGNDGAVREMEAVARSRPAQEILTAPMPRSTRHSTPTGTSPMIRAVTRRTSMYISCDEPSISAAANEISSMPVPGMIVRPLTAWSQRAGTLDVDTLNSTRPTPAIAARRMSL